MPPVGQLTGWVNHKEFCEFVHLSVTGEGVECLEYQFCVGAVIRFPSACRVCKIAIYVNVVSGLVVA